MNDLLHRALQTQCRSVRSGAKKTHGCARQPILQLKDERMQDFQRSNGHYVAWKAHRLFAPVNRDWQFKWEHSWNFE
eukprot:12426435-Karenia_brevis.AAC.1